MTNKEWGGLSDRERDAKVAEALWPEGRPLGHPLRISEMLASTGNGMMLVMAAMRVKGFHYNAESFDDGTDRVEWAKPLGQNKGIQVAAANCNSLPEAAALAALRAMGATNA